jgi:hypothetical protein
MLVKIKYLKDHNGYKAGQEWAMLLHYAERFEKDGIVQILDGDIEKWVIKPEPEQEEEQDDEYIAGQYGVEYTEEEITILDRLFNKKK